MKGWNKTPFAKLLVDSKDGEWGRGEEAPGFRESLIIRGTDFADLYCPGSEFPRRWIKDRLVERKGLKAGDIVLETAGGTSKESTGRSALLKESFFRLHPEIPVLCASFSRHLRLDTKAYSPEFVYYLLQSLHRSGYMAVFNIQHTGVSRFQYTAFKDHTELQIPDLFAQRKIAALLSANDELIENNRRRIALLEKLAEEIYREWFVRMRFPGHRESRKVKGLPADWSVRRVKDVVMRKGFGRIYRSADLSDIGRVVVIDQSRDDALGFHNGDPQHFASSDHPTILFGDHTCKMVFMTKPFSLAENVIPFEAGPGVAPYFLFQMIKDLARTIEYKRHWNDLANREVLMPLFSLQVLFENVAKDQHLQMELLRESIRHLTRTRDLLLPRLISGKLAVEHLDIQFPPGMADE
jgi:type I restriction enzyme S subunit